MTITEFVNRIELYLPTGYTFWSGLHRSSYNQEKLIEDTMLVVFPNPYPSQWRSFCNYNIDVEIWLGKMVNINNSVEGSYQVDPYSPLDVVQEMHLLADALIDDLNDDQYFNVMEVQPYEFFDSPDGKSVNRQVWLKVNVKLKAWFEATPAANVYVVHSGINVVMNDTLIIE